MCKPWSKEDLGDDLCEYCPLEEDQKGSHQYPNGIVVMCEGSHCEAAYDNYVEGFE